jgi:hypothetical protein
MIVVVAAAWSMSQRGLGVVGVHLFGFPHVHGLHAALAHQHPGSLVPVEL